jgi:hypothetical protein
VFLQRWFAQTLAQTVNYLLDQSSVWPRENEQILRTLPDSWQNNEVLRKKPRLAGNDRAVQIDCLGKRASAFRATNKSLRGSSFVAMSAEEICWNAAAASADARCSPRNCFHQNIFPAENGRKPRWQSDR